MASKDLNLSCYIPLLIEMGVTSLKVEGRMRSLYYLATVIGSYRALIDAYYKGELTESFALKYQKYYLRLPIEKVLVNSFKRSRETRSILYRKTRVIQSRLFRPYFWL